jgi:biotin operon repressor
MDPAVQAQIEALRDSGKVIHIYGTLLSNVPDYNGSQILVERIEVNG